MPRKEDPIVLNYHDCLIRQSDVDILKGPYWLSDAIIGFYFEFLQNENPLSKQLHLFVSPEVTQCLKVTPSSQVSVFLDPLQAKDKKFIFLAVNDCENFSSPGGSHWSLLVFSKPEDVFYHFDSSTGCNFDQARKIAFNISDYLGCYNELQEMNTLQQSNSYDCGIHLLCNVKNIATYVINHNNLNNLPHLERAWVVKMRKELVNIIEQISENI